MISSSADPIRLPAVCLLFAASACAGGPGGASTGGLAVEVSPPQPAPLKLPEGVPVARARFVSEGAVRVDGRAGDWQGAAWVVLDRPEQFATNEGGNWKGPDDLSARIAFAFDRGALYVCARVRDDAPGRVFEDGALWRGDSVQVALDPLLERTDGSFGTYDFEFGFPLVDPSATPTSPPGMYCWQGPPPGKVGPVREASLAYGREGGEVIAEASLPLDWPAPLSPFGDGACGMSLLVNDCDVAAEGRKGFLQWTPGIGSRKDPSVYGILLFDPPPAGTGAAVTGHLYCSRAVAPLGMPFEAQWVASASRTTSATVRARVREGARVVAEGAGRANLQEGRSRYSVHLGTGALPPGRYSIEVEAEVDGRVITRQTLPAALYPPGGWEKVK